MVQDKGMGSSHIGGRDETGESFFRMGRKDMVGARHTGRHP